MTNLKGIADRGFRMRIEDSEMIVSHSSATVGDDLARNSAGNPQFEIRDLKSREHGYTLVALLALMSLLALFALAAVPSVQQQTQREREKEAIFRGEQVAQAIRSYYRYRGAQGVNSLPTSMDQLTEGIPKGTKKLQILRPEAAKDPLSSSGEWRLIGPTSQDFAQFVQSLTVYSGGTPPPPKSDFRGLANLIPQMMNVLNTGSSNTAPGGEDTSANSTGPFLGVASRSQRNSVLTYYGIDRHDEWIFTPLFR
jgi:type II secretory pathway pseudopilin PulG